jgi:pilus assembly protein TadC
MAKHEKKSSFMDLIKNGFSYISQTFFASTFSQITEGAEQVMDNIENRLIQTEKIILRRLSSFLIIGLGIVFLIFALFFFMKEFLNLSNFVSSFFIGIIILVIGLVMKIKESERR